MTGEKAPGGGATHETQPGGRAPAPGTLALVQAFVNTHFDLGDDFGADQLASGDDLAAWLAAHGLASGAGGLGEAELVRALTLRETLRALARGGAEVGRARERLDGIAAGLDIRIRFAAGGPRLHGADGPGFEAAASTLLALTARSMLDGTWSRLKVCPGHDCGWLFYDQSRNRSGRWCAMSVCGGREKARTHYRRRQLA